MSRRTSVAAIGLAVMLVLLGAAYLAVGWGLGTSAQSGEYRLAGYWTQASGVPLNQPYAIAVDPGTGNVVVTDAANQRVVVFETMGRVVRTFGAAGEGPGQFALPTGVAVGPGGHVYVADYNQDRIQKFTPTGEYLLEWGGFGTGESEFDSPNGLAVDAVGNVYVADFYNKVVKVFSGNGEFLCRVGQPGHWQLGALDYPTDVDVAEDGRILVADAYNYRVQLFEPNAAPSDAWGWHVLWLWPLPSRGTAGFGEATSATFGAGSGRIHVADARNYRVAMLDAGGRFVTDYVLSHRRSGPFSPMQVAASPDGRQVYATDLANDRVVVLSVAKESATD
jgi:DNA-binding beta-propeller fold protein YncE